MKNKYLLSTALYDSRNMIDNNCLFYFQGIIDKLLISNRDFDIKIHITEKCKDILDKIIKQEEIDTSNIQYIPIRETNDARGMLYRLKACFDGMLEYKYTATCDSDNDYLSNFHDYDEIDNFSMTAPQRILEKELYFMWGDYTIIPGGLCVFNGKNFNTNIVRCLDVINQILACDSCRIFYGFDEQLLTHLCINEFLNGRIKYFAYSNLEKDIVDNYICECVFISGGKHTYKYTKKLSDSKYYVPSSKTYKIEDKNYLLYSIPEGCGQNYSNDNQYQITKRKYLMYKIQQYVMGYTDKFDIYEILH